MEDLEDIEKLNAFLKLENKEFNSVQQELADFIGDEENDDGSEEKSYIDEVEQDIQEIEKEFNSTRRNHSDVCDEKEHALIESCRDEDVKKIMILNRRKNKQLRDLADKLFHLLAECRKQICKEKKAFEDKTLYENISRTCTWKLGFPYFKCSNNFASPPNEDVLKKQNNKELFVNHIPRLRRWSPQEQSILKSAVLFNYFKNRQKQIEQKIRVLKIKLKSVSEESEKAKLKSEINSSEKELEQLQKEGKCDPPLIGCAEGIDWESIANDDLQGKHTANECYSFWNVYLHPEINKSCWTKTEDEKLKSLACRYRYQDWDKIAAELQTGRSGFTVFVHYHSALNEKFKKTRFEPEEDAFLLQVIDRCRVGAFIPWGRVAYFFKDRSRAQLYHRYRYFLQTKYYKKGTFTEAEDILIKLLVKKFGTNFALCAKYIPHRTIVQVRNRYQSYLTREITCGTFTEEEDFKIIKYVSLHGDKRWSEIAEELNRTRAHVRQRYWTIIKWHESNPGKSIKEITRRKRNNQYTKYKTHNFREIIYERFKNLDYIPSLETIEKAIEEERVSGNVPRIPATRRPRSKVHFDVIDSQICEIFKTCHKLKPTNKTTSETNIQQSATAINTILNVLGAKFTNHLTEEKIRSTKNLDELDCKILNYIIKEKSKGAVECNESIPSTSRQSISINIPDNITGYVLPPNIHTLIGLRSLLIKNQCYKDQIDRNEIDSSIYRFLRKKLPAPTQPIARRIEKELLNMNANDRANVINERGLFLKRFYSVFRWPAIMSLCEPKHGVNSVAAISHGPSINNFANTSNTKEGKLNIQKLRGRPRKKHYEKIEKMKEARKRLREKAKSSDINTLEQEEEEEREVNIEASTRDIDALEQESEPEVNIESSTSKDNTISHNRKRKISQLETDESQSKLKVKKFAHQDHTSTFNHTNGAVAQEQQSLRHYAGHEDFINQKTDNSKTKIIHALDEENENNIEKGVDGLIENQISLNNKVHEWQQKPLKNKESPSSNNVIDNVKEISGIKEDIRVLESIIQQEKRDSY